MRWSRCASVESRDVRRLHAPAEPPGTGGRRRSGSSRGARAAGPGAGVVAGAGERLPSRRDLRLPARGAARTGAAPGLGRDPGCAWVHAAVLRLPRSARRARGAWRPRCRPLGAGSRRPARIRRAECDAVPGRRGSRAAARRSARPADLRDLRTHSLQTLHARGRRCPDREGLLSRLPAGRERRRCPEVAAEPMKLVTYDDGKVGRIDGDEIVRLDVPTMRDYFARGGADDTGERTPLADATLRAPIVPKKFFHTAGNFREHEEESKNVNWSHEIAPWIVFFQNVDAIIGTDEAVVYPEHLTEELDYELELAVIIGKDGKWFGPEEAMDYVAGYVIFNDITARDIQRREMRSGVFSFCKAIDTFCPLGPWIVTPDEIPDPHDLAMTLRVNGGERQVSLSSRVSVTVPEILSHCSALGCSAGDVLSTGTVSGVAGFSEDAASLYLQPGDVMEAEIERIGVLRNPVISWQDAHGEPPPERVRW